MDADGQLDLETSARIKLGVELHRRKKTDFIITTGWNHRSDSCTKIGHVVARDLDLSYRINSDEILVDIESRDTVGDAFFLRKNILIPFRIRSVTVVTSDYHVPRAEHIFKMFLTPRVEVVTVGVELGIIIDDNIRARELHSQAAFLRTFKDVDLWNDLEVCRTLSEQHPFYNGEVYPKLNCEESLPLNTE